MCVEETARCERDLSPEGNSAAGMKTQLLAPPLLTSQVKGKVSVCRDKVTRQIQRERE